MVTNLLCILLLVFLGVSDIHIGIQAAPISSSSGNNVPSAETLNFLKRFGYLKAGPPDSEALYQEEAVREAIRTMQYFGAIEETGELDNATMQLMATPRCGVPDVIHRNDSSGNRRKRYVIGSDGWQKRRITYFLANWSPKLGDHTAVFQALTKAFDMWSGYSRLQFQPVEDPNADIVVVFGTHYHGDSYPFDGPNGILAHAYFPYEMDQFGGDVHFDDDEDWTLKPLNDYEGVDFFTVATHELGHSLGLSHSPVPASIMFPYYKGYSPDLRLDYDDIMAMYQLYISKPLLNEDVDNDADDDQREKTPAGTPAPRSPPKEDDPSDDEEERQDDEDEKDALDKEASQEDEIDPTFEGDYDTVDHHRNKDRTPEIPPDLCSGNYSAIGVLRGELFIFKEKFVWRLSRRGQIESGYPVSLSRMFPGFPEWVDHVDAVYERPTDGSIIFFIGNYFWVSNGDEFLDSPRSISEYGLPDDVDALDAALVWGKNGKTYLYSGDRYWRFLENETRLDEGYPQNMERWRGVPSDLDAAMRWTDGQTYFFKGKAFWRFDDTMVIVDDRYPLPSPQYWIGCPEELSDTWW